MNQTIFNLSKMKKKTFLVLLTSTSMFLACNQESKKTQIKVRDSIPVVSHQSIDTTYIYRGVFATKYDRPAVGSMALTMIDGKDEGTFVYKVDYGEGVDSNGRAVMPYVDHGTFNAENSDELGTIYVMKGQQPAPFYYRPIDNKLSELGPDKKQMTGNILTGIDPKDSVRTRADILGSYSENKALSPGLFWSTMNRQIMAQGQADVKLDPLSDKIAKNPAFIVFNKNQSLAELFLPETKTGLILKRKGSEGGYIWTDGRYELFQWKGYVLRYKNGKSIFAGD